MRKENVIGYVGMLLTAAFWILLGMFDGRIKQSYAGKIQWDILFYVVLMIVSFFAYIIFYWCGRYLFGKKKQISDFSSRKEATIELLVMMFLGGQFVLAIWNAEFTGGSGAYIRFWSITGKSKIIFGLTAGVLALLICFGLRYAKGTKESKIQSGICKTIYVLVSVLAGYAIYQPNIFQKFAVYHFHAVFNSVYRVLMLQPYSEVNAGVYGFYGLLLAPLTKLFGGDSIGCIIALSVLTGASTLAFCYVVHNSTNRMVLRVLASVALMIPYVAMNANLYTQLFPLRMVFPSFMLAYLVFWYRRGWEKKIFYFGAVIIGVLSVVWNLESGLACLLALTGVRIISDLQHREMKHLSRVLRDVGNILLIPTGLIGAYAVVALYNYCVSGNGLSKETALFPYIDNPYTAVLTLEMEHQRYELWMAVCLLMMLAIGFVLSSTLLAGFGEQDKKSLILGATTILAVVLFTYYINRSVYGNLYVVLPFAVLILCIFAQTGIEAYQSEENGMGYIRGVGCIAILVLTFLVGIVGARYVPVAREKNLNRDIGAVETFADEISKNVPEDVLAVGIGVPEIYSIMGRDTGFYGIDIADIAVLKSPYKEQTVEQVLGEDELFTSVFSLESMVEAAGAERVNDFMNTHHVVWEYTIGDQVYRYYKR